MLCLLLGVQLLVAPQDTLVLGVEEAVTRAIAVSPFVTAAAGAVAAPRGERAESRLPFPSNPSLEFERVSRTSISGVGNTVYDRGFALRQEIEIGGQGFVRASAAGMRIDAAERRVDNARRVVGLQARLAYVRLAIAQRRAAQVDTAAQFAERLADVARNRLNAGAINLIEYNTATLEAARQRSVAYRALADEASAAADLVRILALAPGTALQTAGLPSLPTEPAPSGIFLTGYALDERPDHLAALLTAEAGGRALTAARLDGWVPRLELGGVIGQEAEQDDLFGFTIGLNFPLFRRNQAATGIAQAERIASEAGAEGVRRSVRSEVEAALSQYEHARGAERLFVETVLRAAAENVTLSELSFDEGKIGIAEVIVLRTTAVATQLEYLEVLTDAYEGWYRLAAAVGIPPTRLNELTGGQQ
jgi:outer membrane protein, heavy metal efflux system